MFKLKKKIFYSDCSIPARLFFDHIIHGDISVLGVGNNREVHNAYWSIINEFCELDNNNGLLKWFKLQVKLSNTERAIHDVQTLLFPIKHLCEDEYQIEVCVKFLNALKYPVINFDTSKPLQEEIQRIESQVIGILHNELEMQKPAHEQEHKKIVKDFNDRLVAVENMLGRSIDDDVTLRKFISLEKSAYNKMNQLKKANG